MATNCPLGRKTCNECNWNVRLIGKNPQTGQDVDDTKCAMAWIPILLVDNLRNHSGTTAAIESFRNEMVKGNQNTANMLAGMVQGVLGHDER